LLPTIVTAAVALVAGLAADAPRPSIVAHVGIAIVPLALLGLFVAAIVRLLAHPEYRSLHLAAPSKRTATWCRNRTTLVQRPRGLIPTTASRRRA
jgi:hypothetical protein